MGGGAFGDHRHARHAEGLSPRGRGSRFRPPPQRRLQRSIPAWAGEPLRRPVLPPQDGVYPRVGGGAVITHRPPARKGGLSPRGRGSLVERRLKAGADGSIPAWAGEPHSATGRIEPSRVYPRVGGGATSPSAPGAELSGLSPRGRGSHHRPVTRRSPPRSIPAWAGEPRRPARTRSRSWVYPRVGGGAFAVFNERRLEPGLSPRGRGSRSPCRSMIPSPGSIPAWAGEPPCAPIGSFSSRVYPRVGGGADGGAADGCQARGLSPRGRGSPGYLMFGWVRRRSIPAWAGEPALARRRTRGPWVYPRVGGGAILIQCDRSASMGLSPRGRGSRRT